MSYLHSVYLLKPTTAISTWQCPCVFNFSLYSLNIYPHCARRKASARGNSIPPYTDSEVDRGAISLQASSNHLLFDQTDNLLSSLWRTKKRNSARILLRSETRFGFGCRRYPISKGLAYDEDTRPSRRCRLAMTIRETAQKLPRMNRFRWRFEDQIFRPLQVWNKISRLTPEEI